MLTGCSIHVKIPDLIILILQNLTKRTFLPNC